MDPHVAVSLGDFERALRFYQPVMAALGLGQCFCDPARPWADWHGAGGAFWRALNAILHRQKAITK